MRLFSHPFAPLRPQRVVGVATGHRIINAARLQHPQHIGGMLRDIFNQVDDFMTEGDIAVVLITRQPRVGLINDRQVSFQAVGLFDGLAGDINADPSLNGRI